MGAFDRSSTGAEKEKKNKKNVRSGPK